MWDPESSNQSICLLALCHKLRKDFSIFEAKRSKPVKVKSTPFSCSVALSLISFFYNILKGELTMEKVERMNTHHCQKYSIEAEAHFIEWRLNISHHILIKNVDECLCLFMSHTGIHTGCNHPAEEHCWRRCLYSSLPQNVCFFLFVTINANFSATHLKNGISALYNKAGIRLTYVAFAKHML